MENSCRKKHKPSSKKWIPASRRVGFRRNSALIPANAGLFHYAGNCPVRYIDPDGRAAWESYNEWSSEYIDDYSKYINAKIDEYIEKGKKFTCEDLSLSLLIDFASENNLPVTIKNESGTYSSCSDDFSNITDFKNTVLSTTAAADLEKNTIGIDLAAIQPGDLICMDTGTPNGAKDNKYSHIQVVSRCIYNFLGIKQGNISSGSSKYNSVFYGGEKIQGRAYDFKNDVFINTYKNSLVPNACSAFGMSFRRWNFYGM